MQRNPLIDCVGKAKRAGVLTDAEVEYVLKRAAKLGDGKKAVQTILRERMSEYEAIKPPPAADKVVTQTQNETVAMAAYMEEVRNATKQNINPQAQKLSEAPSQGAGDYRAAATGHHGGCGYRGSALIPDLPAGAGSCRASHD